MEVLIELIMDCTVVLYDKSEVRDHDVVPVAGAPGSDAPREDHLLKNGSSLAPPTDFYEEGPLGFAYLDPALPSYQSSLSVVGEPPAVPPSTDVAFDSVLGADCTGPFSED